MQHSQLFQPYRAVGFICDSNPFHLKRLGSEHFLTVSIGKAWQVYNCDKLRLALIGPSREQRIRAIASIQDLTFTACGTEIIVWKRMKEVRRLKGPHSAPITHLLIFGRMLISVDENCVLCKWDLASSAVVSRPDNTTAQEVARREKRRLKRKARKTATGSDAPTASQQQQEEEEEEKEREESEGEGEGRQQGSSKRRRRQSDAGSSEEEGEEEEEEESGEESSGEESEAEDPNGLTGPLPARSGASDGVPYEAMQLPVVSGRRVTVLMHPATYVNKVVIGYSTGQLQLWNLRTRRRLYEFCGHKGAQQRVASGRAADTLAGLAGLRAEEEDEAFAITAAEQSTAVDVVAVGDSRGLVTLLNLRFDESIAVLRHDGGQPVNALAFRKDGVAQLASATPAGHIFVWDLEKRQLAHVIRNAHDASISSLAFLPNEPLLISSGADNAIKMWIFDQPDGSARLLRSRSGHSAPPHRVRFYQEDSNQGQTLLSAGQDRALRFFSIIREQQGVELSQGNLNRKAKARNLKVEELRLPPVVDFVASNRREREWVNILSCHSGDSAAYTWSYETKAIGKYKLANRDRTDSPATAVAISACGNFGIVGAHNGVIEVYNLQSGLFRGTFSLIDSPTADAKQARPGQPLPKRVERPAHEGPVTGLAVDGLNRILVSSSLDGTVKFWSFPKRTLEGVLELQCPVSRLAFSVDSDLLCALTDDQALHVIDMNTHKVVRRFGGKKQQQQAQACPVTDLTFSPDGRWLVTASSDGSVRVFDLPSARLIDWFRFDSPVTSLAFSPRGDMLATTHTDNLGIFLWVNRSYFGPVFLSSIPEEPAEMELPALATFSEDAEEMAAATLAEREEQQRKQALAASPQDEEVKRREQEEKEKEDKYKDLFSHVAIKPTPKPLEADMITLSALPRSRWQNLPLLDLIKERNKPKEAPKAPAQPSFFLQAATGSAADAALLAAGLVQEEEKKDPLASSRIIRGKKQEAEMLGSPLHRLLKQADAQAHEPGAYSRVISFLRALPPAALDAEIRSLGSILTASSEQEARADLARMMRMFAAALRDKTDFEFIQALLNLFLKVHSETIVKDETLVAQAAELAELQKRVWRKLEGHFHAALCIVGHLAKLQ